MIKLGECTLDPLTLSLIAEENTVALTPIEVRLLATLGRSPDVWIDESNIREIVWGDCHRSDAPLDDRIEASLARLRRKLRTYDLPIVLNRSRKFGLRLQTPSNNDSARSDDRNVR